MGTVRDRLRLAAVFDMNAHEGELLCAAERRAALTQTAKHGTKTLLKRHY